jgi:arginine decarboxylase
VKELLDIRRSLPKLNKLEAHHDALEHKEDAHSMFALGLLDLPDKAKIESLYWEISAEVVRSFRGQAYIPEEIRRLEDSLADQYLCNFSVFQSLLDHWALDSFSHHADQPPRRAPDARRHAGRHHLRLRRPGESVH